MILKEVTINTTTVASDLVADILNEIDSKGVGIYDNQDFLDLESEGVLWDYADESLLQKNEVVKVKGYFEIDEIDSKLKELNTRLDFLKDNSPFNLGSLEVTVSEVEADNWYENWKSSYKPIHAGRLVVVPNWIKYDKLDDEVVISMDPGMAFGSGEHESTKMCLNFIQEINVENKTVIDVGTGSGILAIAAAKLGAKSVEAYDIDQVAVLATIENAKLNNLTNIKADNANLLNKTTGKFDIVLANITADVLMLLSDSLKDYMKANGVVIISGIILEREQEVLNHFLKNGYKQIKINHMNGWASMMFGI